MKEKETKKKALGLAYYERILIYKDFKTDFISTEYKNPTNFLI